MKSKKLLSLVLSIALLLPVFSLPITANAVEVENVYSGSIPVNEKIFIEPSGASVAVDSKAVATVRNALRNHETELFFQIPLPVPVTTVSVTVKASKPNDKAYCENYAETLFKQAVEHTGNPIEGDYIFRQMSYMHYNVEPLSSESMKITYEIDFFTTKEQENQLDTKVNEIIKSLNLNGKSDYQKVKAIYDYLCNNVVYDDVDLFVAMSTEGYLYFPIAHSAYGALYNNIAVCQGYAVAFYRLSLAAGVDSRVIFGEAPGGGHAWNIVKLDGKYYLLDATWDAGQSEYKYFLKCEKDFPDHEPDAEHKTAEWKKKYPIASTSYKVSSDSKTPVYDTIGDIDGNGEINSSDSLKVLRISVKIETTSHKELADVNGDGSIDSSDALNILRYSVKLPANPNIGKKVK